MRPHGTLGNCKPSYVTGAYGWEMGEKEFCRSGKEHELDHGVNKKKLALIIVENTLEEKRAWGLVKKLSFVKSS